MDAPVRISATMALDAIEEACEEVIQTRHALRQKIQDRDYLIQVAKHAGIPYSTLGRRTRLSLNTLQAIMAKPEPIDATAS